eukprot:gene7407-13162_t
MGNQDLREGLFALLVNRAQRPRLPYFHYLETQIESDTHRFTNKLKMPHYRGCVGEGDNDHKYLDKIVKRSRVEGELKCNDETSSQGTSGVNDYQKERQFASPCIKFELTRDSDVKLFTGLENAEVFQAVFEYLQPQAVTMVYWRGPKNTSVSLFKRHSIHGNRKLLLEEESFMVMQRLRLELFIETPSSLKAQALCWSEYKHHSTVKVLLEITPNGAFSYVSDAYGGRASDNCIVESSDFLQLLQPGDACTLARPPSTQKNLQLNEIDVAKTSRVANAKIYVEQAIRKLKEFQILKNELPISLLPVVNDIVKVCAALVNFQKPLVS